MNTKYPIILVHGIIIKDIGLIKSFGKIDSNLKAKGFKVYKSKIDGFATIENNALALKKEIDRLIDKWGCGKVNIIAHSKGGLDAKYMIQNLGMEDKVASLTTLCTPHKGSPIASSILKSPRWILKFLAFWINLFYRIFGDKNPDSLTVCEELAQVDENSSEVFDTCKTYCQSYSSKLEDSKDDFVMGLPHKFYNKFTNGAENDGLVSPDSASSFGEYKGKAIEGSWSHSEIVDFMVKKKKREKVYSFYYKICENLIAKGF